MYGLVQQHDSFLHSGPPGKMALRIAGECTNDNTMVTLVSDLPFLEHALFSYLGDEHNATYIDIDREYQQSMIIPTGRYALFDLADSCKQMTGICGHVLPFVYSSINEYRERFPESIGMIRSVEGRLWEHPVYQQRLHALREAVTKDDLQSLIAMWELKSLFGVAVAEHQR